MPARCRAEGGCDGRNTNAPPMTCTEGGSDRVRRVVRAPPAWANDSRQQEREVARRVARLYSAITLARPQLRRFSTGPSWTLSRLFARLTTNRWVYVLRAVAPM